MSDQTNSQKLDTPDSTSIPYGTAGYPVHKDADAADIAATPPGDDTPSTRIAANTALLKISRSSGDNSGESNNSGLMGFGSSGDEQKVEDGEGGAAVEEASTEAASARIAQEYRRQVRIKRLAEEIQHAEKEKKKENARRKDGTGPTKNEETAKLPALDGTNLEELSAEDAEQMKKRLEAMNAFKGANSVRSKTNVRLFTVAMVTLLLAGGLAGVLVLLARIDAAKQELANEAAERAQKLVALSRVADPKVAALESKLEHEQQARAEAEKKTQEEKHAREEALRAQEEQARVLRIEREYLLAEAKRAQESTQKLEDENRKRDDDIRKRAEEATRIAREKMKREKDEIEAGKHSVAATPQGEVRTSPPQPVGIAGKSDLPTGAVRLFCKASDPYGGRLTFHWKQVKGANVEIADPNFAVMKDGKWFSQTYFVAREPGSYEFEVSVKNEDGVETTRKYPIDVLPVTTLK